MRYFLDTEFNGFGGELISIALVPEQGDQEFYAVLPLPADVHPWVALHVIPYLRTVPPGLYQEMGMVELGEQVARYLEGDPHPVIVADWPDDIARFCNLLMPAPGHIVDVGSMDFQFMRRPGFSTAANSKVPHNALHDARSLMALALEEDTFEHPRGGWRG